MTLENILVIILCLGILATLLMATMTKKLHRMLMYFLIANGFLFGVLAIYGMTILASLILLVNISVVAIFLLLGMVVGEVTEE
ncbi:MAG: hypothetical protein Q6363_005925 [Candidatus Njordarchaeota archaeon]